MTGPDDDFGDPNIIKEIYEIVITYKSAVAVNMNALLSYGIDGKDDPDTTTYVPATSIGVSATDWNVAVIELSTSVQCQSFRWKLGQTTAAQKFYINDVGVRFRPIPTRVVA
jgi:hypothetical protein